MREDLVFAIQDVILDPPFTHLDLIVARNILIYFNINLQNKLIPIFNYSLNNNGLLFMGTAETVGKFTEVFNPLDRKWKIYESYKKVKNLPQDVIKPPIIKKINQHINHKQKASNGMDPKKLLLQALPPSLLLDSNYNISYIHGDVSKYLRLSEGVPKINVLNLIKDEYRSFLVTGLKEAKSGKIPVIDEIISSEKGTQSESVLMTIKPVQPEKDSEGSIIVTFEKGVEKHKKNHKKEDTFRSLENKLKQARQTLRNTIEELESSNEELRSANEEYQSTNEELQGTNEELETSREELQSVNEELTTINFEHQKKIEELVTLSDDFKNLLNSTGVATVFLDNNLKLLRFTPKASDIFNFLETDTGRPLSDITHRVKDIDLRSDAQWVLESLKGIERGVQMDNGKRYVLRIYPYRTGENRIAGVGITLIDVGKTQPPELDFNCLDLVFEEIRQPLLLLDDKLKVLMANKAFYNYFSDKPENIKGKKLFQVDKHWDTPELKRKLEKTLVEGVRLSNFKIKYRTSDKKNEEFFLNGKRVYDNKKNNLSLFLTISD
ncbi:MAG: PAS domain-containing protein [Actinomycetota bacterium]|nr:PAS domain-containing protein [Actinomycetota bacterium]